jgi:hypothetical protein
VREDRRGKTFEWREGGRKTRLTKR